MAVASRCEFGIEALWLPGNPGACWVPEVVADVVNGEVLNSGRPPDAVLPWAGMYERTCGGVRVLVRVPMPSGGVRPMEWAGEGSGEAWERTWVRRAMRSACTAAEMESPLPSASIRTMRHVREKKRSRTRETRLADLAPAPVEIVALAADPVAGLVGDGPAVAGVEDGRGDADDVGGTDLGLLGEGLVVGPVHDARVEGVAGDVLHPAPDGKGATAGGEEGVGGRGLFHGATGDAVGIATI